MKDASIFWKRSNQARKDFFLYAFNQPRQRLSSMADSIFLLHRKFRRGFSQFRQKKIRIVTEPTLPRGSRIISPCQDPSAIIG